MVKLSCGCFCGGMRYQVNAPLHSARSCHCSCCRKAFNGADSAYAQIEPASPTWIQGAQQLCCLCASIEQATCGTRGSIEH